MSFYLKLRYLYPCAYVVVAGRRESTRDKFEHNALALHKAAQLFMQNITVIRQQFHYGQQ